MASIWIDEHGSGMGKPGERVTGIEAGRRMMAAWDDFTARGYVVTDDRFAGHVVMRCPRHVEGACAQINVQKR